MRHRLDHVPNLVLEHVPSLLAPEGIILDEVDYRHDRQRGVRLTGIVEIFGRDGVLQGSMQGRSSGPGEGRGGFSTNGTEEDLHHVVEARQVAVGESAAVLESPDFGDQRPVFENATEGGWLSTRETRLYRDQLHANWSEH
jgi:hypothetical protein